MHPSPDAEVTIAEDDHLHEMFQSFLREATERLGLKLDPEKTHSIEWREGTKTLWFSSIPFTPE